MLCLLCRISSSHPRNTLHWMISLFFCPLITLSSLMLSALQHDEVSLEVNLPSTSVKDRIGPWIIVSGSYLLIGLCNRIEISCKIWCYRKGRWTYPTDSTKEKWVQVTPWFHWFWPLFLNSEFNVDLKNCVQVVSSNAIPSHTKTKIEDLWDM